MKHLFAIVAGVLAAVADAAAAAPVTPPPPRWLGETGLGEPGTFAFAPQYPLWSDGAAKRRWIRLPAGAAIDASRPDAWEFPVGTKLWKEFAHDRRIETRMIERMADGSWRFATYVWSADGAAAELAPDEGIRALAVASAPNGRYVVPSRADCLACHAGPSVPVLGFTAVQLALELRDLVARGVLQNLPPSLLTSAPRIAAGTPAARAALGYLHGNCGHCHNDAGAVAGVDLVLAQRAADPDASVEATLRSVFGRASRFRAPGGLETMRESAIAQRMRSANPYTRMPPLGVQVVDREGVALVERWLHTTSQEAPR